MEKPQVVVMGEKVYMGGGDNEDYQDSDDRQVFEYDPSRDEWSRLPHHQLIGFGMAQFKGNLITVGGMTTSLTGILQAIATTLLQRDSAKGYVTGKVYHFKEQSQKWEEFLKPMPTARYHLSVATTKSAIVASGGSIGYRNDNDIPCATVEVYSSETSQWHTADPLPIPCYGMTSVTIADTWYQLGGIGADGKYLTTVPYAALTAFTQKATSPRHRSASLMSVWKTLPDTPLERSAAASMSGSLLAVGGYSGSQAVLVFLPLTNSWFRLSTGDLPEPRYACTAVQLSFNQLLVVGGKDDRDKRTNTVFLGTITL